VYLPVTPQGSETRLLFDDEVILCTQDLGPSRSRQGLTDEDRSYVGSRYSDVEKAIFGTRYWAIFMIEGIPSHCANFHSIFRSRNKTTSSALQL
jgi:hypothetical protein